jgi:hypothetical protein
VVLSDGEVEDRAALLGEAERLRTAGSLLLTVGVGPRPRMDVLRAMASTPEHYFAADEDFDLGESFANLATWVPQEGA